MPTPPPHTLAHILLAHVDQRGDQTAYEYLHDDGQVEALTYRELWDRAMAGARQLHAGGSTGPALLLYPPGLDFVTAVWACFLAGVPAVPAYPPLFGPADRIAQRFARVVADSRASTLLADPMVLALLTPAGTPDWLPAVVTLGWDHAPIREASLPLPGPRDVALIQYTSGSTSQPKGVVLEHRNLLANVQAIMKVFGLDRSTRAISWLPPYHDMGLIGFILTPVYGGFPVRLMSPVKFMKDPLSWLKQISEMGATHTGGPNFAYDLCLRRAGGTDLSDLDLSTWRLAFNGAEPIRPGTLTRFAERFAGNGFRSESFLPCYGLAEATLLVTARYWSDQDGLDTQGRVDCGPVIEGHRLAIVDPATGTPVDDGREGEIWVSGPSVSPGYWNDTGQPEEELFGSLDGVRHLRTGDLGVMRDGHLVVTGRLKDVLIQHGVNHHAHDVEAAAVEDNPSVRATAAAFSLDDDRLVLAVELARKGVDAAALGEEIRTRVLRATGVRLDEIVLCPPRTIPRTTSGKIQRRLARARYLAGELTGEVVAGATTSPPTVDTALTGFLAVVFAAVCEVPQCGPTQALASIGGDSVRAAEIAAFIEDTLQAPVPVELVLDAQTPRDLAVRLTRLWASQGITESTIISRIGALPRGEQPAAR